MKNKQKIILPVAVIMAAAVAIFAVWCFFPKTFLRDTAPSDVKSISVVDGTNGKSFVVEDPAEVKYILENIQSVIMRKDGISKGKKGWRFDMSFCGSDGSELDRLYVEGKSWIRRDPYYYCSYRGNGRLCFDYLAELEKKYTE